MYTIQQQDGSSASDRNSVWEDLDGDIELFLALQEVLTGERSSSCWQHERLDWDLHAQKLLHEDRFHIRHRMPLKDFDALVVLWRQILKCPVADVWRQCVLK